MEEICATLIRVIIIQIPPRQRSALHNVPLLHYEPRVADVTTKTDVEFRGEPKSITIQGPLGPVDVAMPSQDLAKTWRVYYTVVESPGLQ